MPRLKNQLPRYRRHKASGQAVVTLNGKDFYLGPHGTQTSKNEYDTLIAEWLAAGRQLPSEVISDLTISELYLAFIEHAEQYYRKPDGTPTTGIRNHRQALKPLIECFADLPAVEFGPLKLEVVRENMIGRGWCRNSINRNVSRIKSFFKWAASKEMIPVSVYQGLATVAGLKAGRSAAAESSKVKPVSQDVIDAVLPFVSPQVQAMIQLQLLTAARSGEIVRMTASDIDMSGDRWVFRLADHKTAHHGLECVIPLGPKAQVVIAPFIDRDPAEFLFKPVEAEMARRAKQHDIRLTPLSYGNRPGANK